MRRLLRISILVLAAATLAGCANFAPKRPDIPVALINDAAVGPLTTAKLRYWGDDPEFAAGHTRVKPGSDGRVDFLTLSGGGINGAYGAGYLVGWSQSGKRPEFEVVTGISVGAIIAPLALLGPKYDGRLHQVLESLSQASNPKANVLSAVFGAPAMLDNAPVRRAIALSVDEQVLSEVAAAHRAGRRLYVGTTNLDAQRPVVWDIGAIANSTLPDKLQLVREIILASTAVPTVFSPVLIDVDAQGVSYNEMHVDGGVTEQVLLMPGGWGKVGNASSARLYVIFNGVVDASPTTVQMTSMRLLERSLPTLLKYLGRANLAELANSARRSGVKYNITAIPGSFPESDSLFGSPQWLAQLYQYGLDSGKMGSWREQG